MGVDEMKDAGYYNTQRLDFERQIAKQIEDNVKRLLSGKYGPDGVTAVATVSLDYDKMMSETKQYEPRENGDGGGVMNHYEEQYSLNSATPVEGIVGEENNTDAPTYPNQDGTGDGSTTDYYKNVDYDVSYVLTQIEKGEPILKKASVAVIVNDPDFDEETEDTLVDLISKAANITSDNIRVTNLNFETQQVIAPADTATLSPRQILLFAFGGLLFLLVLVIVIILVAKKERKRREEEEAELQEEEDRQQELERQKEIEEHKRMLQNEAMASANTKENAITEEVREFAKENPEITAALLRSLLKEEN